MEQKTEISREIVARVLDACQHVKNREDSDCGPYNDCPYGYMMEELITNTYKEVNKDLNTDE